MIKIDKNNYKSFLKRVDNLKKDQKTIFKRYKLKLNIWNKYVASIFN
jgi:DNA-binding ferritin-like protein (Dps family)